MADIRRRVHIFLYHMRLTGFIVMKRFLIIILFASIIPWHTPLYSQAVKDKADKDKKEATAAPKKAVEGYNNLKWGIPIADAKKEVMGMITFTDDKKVISSKDGNIEYRYGFFYKDIPTPATATADKTGTAAADKTGTATAADKTSNSRLFYVTVSYPYLALEDIRKKIDDQYGVATGESMKDNHGAVLWDFEKTTVILWVDQYEKKPFSRKMTYIGKEITGELNKYYQEIFSSTEIEIINKIKP